MNRTDGIVLRVIDYGETSKIVTLLTAKYGKIAALAKGANKPQSRFASVSQPFIQGQWLLYGGNTGMFSVGQADIINSFRQIREDLFLSSYAACMAELVDKVMEERELYPGVFSLVLNMFQHLIDKKDPEILLRIFEIKMFYPAGIQPNMELCSRCGRQLNTSARFSIGKGGPLCENCHDADPYSLWMKPATYKLFRLFQVFDPARLGNIKVGDDVKQQLDKINRQCLEEQGGIYLKSRQFLDQLHKYGL